jgi:hypothetical protein
MERQDDSLSTRDLAGTAREAPVESVAEPTSPDAPPAEQDEGFGRESAAGDAPGARTGEATAGAPTAEPAGDTTESERASDAAPSDPQVSAPRDAPEPVHGAAQDIDEAGSLLPDGEETDFQRRWEDIQTRFVDDPRQAVEDADALVAGVMQRIAEGFAQARDGLEGQWSRGEDVGTEELRVALQRYRAFFRRLLSA